MRVLQLWRYPVKSLQGERVDESEIGRNGLLGDRAYALFDVATGLGLTARRAPEMLFAAARLLSDGAVRITLPDGSVAADDAALSSWLGRPVRLLSTAAVVQRRYENPSDIETEAAESWRPFEGSTGAFHDSGSAAVTVLSTAGAAGQPVRRFRANIMVDEGGEDAFLGREVSVGSAVLAVGKPIARCVMVTRAQPGGIEVDRDVLRRIHRDRGGHLAVGGVVTAPGVVRVGDPVSAR